MIVNNENLLDAEPREKKPYSDHKAAMWLCTQLIPVRYPVRDHVENRISTDELYLKPTNEFEIDK